MQRGTCQNQPIPRRVVLVKRLTEFTLDILHPMTFVDNHVYPLDLAQQRSLLDDVLVRREADLEVERSDLVVLILSLGRGAFENHRSDGRCPFLELHRPIGQGGQGDND